MGKAKRNKEQKIEREAAQAEVFRQERDSRRGRLVLGLRITAILLAAALITVGGIFLVKGIGDAGYALRRTIVAETEHFQVTGAMASYYLYENYTGFRESNSSYVDSLFDPSLSLKEQQYPSTGEGEEPITWFRYFTDATTEQIRNYLILAEKSRAEGMTLGEADTQAIEDEITYHKGLADKAGQSFNEYLRIHFGRGVREQDLRDALTLYYTANLYYAQYVSELAVSDAERRDYADTHRKEFYTASYYQYTVEAVYDVTTATDADIEAAVAEAKREADALAALPDPDSFYEAVKARVLAAGEAESVAEATRHADVSSCEVKDADDFLFSPAEPARKTGDALVLKGTEKYTVFYVIEPAHADTEESRSFRHILLTADKCGGTALAETKANEILAAIQSAGGTADAFDSAADADSEDVVILYEDNFADGLEEPLRDWLFDPARVPGELAAVTSGDDVHVMRYEGTGLCGWEQKADSALRTERANAMMAALEEQYPVTLNESAFEKIDI